MHLCGTEDAQDRCGLRPRPVVERERHPAGRVRPGCPQRRAGRDTADRVGAVHANGDRAGVGHDVVARRRGVRGGRRARGRPRPVGADAPDHPTGRQVRRGGCERRDERPRGDAADVCCERPGGAPVSVSGPRAPRHRKGAGASNEEADALPPDRLLLLHLEAERPQRLPRHQARQRQRRRRAGCAARTGDPSDRTRRSGRRAAMPCPPGRRARRAPAAGPAARSADRPRPWRRPVSTGPTAPPAPSRSIDVGDAS